MIEGGVVTGAENIAELAEHLLCMGSYNHEFYTLLPNRGKKAAMIHFKEDLERTGHYIAVISNGKPTMKGWGYSATATFFRQHR